MEMDESEMCFILCYKTYSFGTWLQLTRSNMTMQSEKSIVHMQYESPFSPGFKVKGYVKVFQ